MKWTISRQLPVYVWICLHFISWVSLSAYDSEPIRNVTVHFRVRCVQLCSMRNRDEITVLVGAEKPYPAWIWCRRKSHPVESEKSPKRNQNEARLTIELSTWSLFPVLISRGGSRGKVRGVRPPHPPSLEMTCAFLMQLVFCKKNYVVYWCWSRARDECTPS